MTSTLLDEDFGVIDAANEEAEAVEDVNVCCVVKFALTTCRTDPLVGVLKDKIRQAVPFQISSVSKSVV
jgi:hypothetical protein